MDGFEGSDQVVVIAASNLLDKLDPALLRPGRFDRQIFVSPPDLAGREAVLEVHTREKPLVEVDLERVARHTSGLTGADLANIANEAAIQAGRAGREVIIGQDFDWALERVVAGMQSRRAMNDHEKRVVAYHEAGHALCSELLPSVVDKVHKISIVPRGKALGYVLNLPEEDRYLKSREELLDHLVVLLAGRVAEDVVFGAVTTGAADDLNKAYEISRAMVTDYGMSSMGSRAIPISDYSVSDDTRRRVDEAQEELADTAYGRATELIVANRPLLEKLASRLLENEVLERPEIERIVADHGRVPSFEEALENEGLTPERFGAEDRRRPSRLGRRGRPSRTDRLPMTGDGAGLGRRLRERDLSAAPAALNLIEDRSPEGRESSAALLAEVSPAALGSEAPAHLIGVTGPPGAGKSSLLSALVRAWRGSGRTVAVLAVDPSSKRSGGSLLGDRARIDHDPEDQGVLIRSTAAGGRLGGLAPPTREAVQALAAAFDIVVVETVGVGQSETDVEDVADTVAVVVQPGSGDTLQFLKSGIMEVPDVLVVTKADLGDTALRARRDLASALRAMGAREVPGGGRVLALAAAGHRGARGRARRPSGEPRRAGLPASVPGAPRPSPSWRPSTVSGLCAELGGRREAERLLCRARPGRRRADPGGRARERAEAIACPP